ncbi:MAG: LLM class flavin-dependent oxidoreductase [Actinobacteria bacterium]|nr:LLM class flavin-dependent oxidoreductase [Actinomycetota bacterium]MBU1493728.1 LLM class flavin-dependent oxidoreductase [Actinomycetota bacterium]MBU1865332.1 LLM class flavin-dependent oxidoreductase [Actinomycetota bacterium]
MRYGISVPNFGDYGNTENLIRLARTAETAGWDAVFLWDHIQIGHWAGDVLDPWVAMTAIAAVTKELIVGPMVTPLPRRRPTKLAREAVTLDHFSGGRLILGVGIGWPPDIDFGNFGDAADDRTRGAQLDEGLEVLAGLWTGETFNHAGEHYTVVDARFRPTPLQQPRIPIWVGGMWPHRPAFRRAARWDGVYPIVVDENYDFAPMTPATFRDILMYVSEHRQADTPFDAAAGGSLIDESDAAGCVAPWAEAGATWWIESAPFPRRPVEEFLSYVAAGPPR